MKPFIFKILLLFFALFVISCDNEADELVKYYKSQNHSEELKGWWRQINYDQDEENPRKVFFDDYKIQKNIGIMMRRKFIFLPQAILKLKAMKIVIIIN